MQVALALLVGEPAGQSGTGRDYYIIVSGLGRLKRID